LDLEVLRVPGSPEHLGFLAVPLRARAIREGRKFEALIQEILEGAAK
jgi:hypothetical protein